MTDFRIEQTGNTKRIFLDNADITDCVTGVEVDVESYAKFTKVTLNLNIQQVEITTLGEKDVTVQVMIPDDVAKILMYLGWNPPQEKTTYYQYRMNMEGTAA